MRAESVRAVSASPTLARIRFRVRPPRRRGIIRHHVDAGPNRSAELQHRGASMNKLLPIAIAFGMFSGNAAERENGKKLDLLTAATLYPEETKAALARKRENDHARTIGFWVFMACVAAFFYHFT